MPTTASEQRRRKKPHNRAKHAKNVSRWERKRAAERRIELAAYKLEQGCIDCGYKKRAIALQFDHRDPTVKESQISGMLRSASTKRLWAEVAKCDVRCANCHWIRHEDER